MVAAFRGASRYDPLRAGLASSLQDRPAGQRSNPSPLATAVDGMLPQTSVLSSPTVGSRQLDFGEAEQRALDAQAQVDQERAIESLEASERRARNVALAAAMIDEFSKSDAPLESIETRVANAIARVVEEQGEEKANRLLNNVSVSVTPKDGETEFDVRGLLAFDENGEKDTFVFGEMGYTRADDQDALNVGVGIRALNPSGTAMVGINAFYDRELSVGHERASVGVELVTSPIQLAANRYYALSGSQDVGSGQTETPLSGHDIDTKIALPYLNGLFAGYNQSVWYSETGPDIERNRYSISGNLSEHLSLEISRSEYSRVLEDTDRAKLSYNYVFGATNDTPTLFSLNSDAYSFEPIGDQMRYRMVPRENDIVTETADSGGLLVRFRML